MLYRIKSSRKTTKSHGREARRRAWALAGTRSCPVRFSISVTVGFAVWLPALRNGPGSEASPAAGGAKRLADLDAGIAGCHRADDRGADKTRRDKQLDDPGGNVGRAGDQQAAAGLRVAQQ